jgi:hypothetical protein
MGLDRKLRRQQQRKNGNAHLGSDVLGSIGQITKVIGDLKQVQDLGKAAEGLPELLSELRAMRDSTQEVLAKNAELELELARQRAVFLRFFWVNDVLFSPGPELLSKFLAAEQRYRSEYDAMCVLMKLLSWAKEAP